MVVKPTHARDKRDAKQQVEDELQHAKWRAERWLLARVASAGREMTKDQWTYWRACCDAHQARLAQLKAEEAKLAADFEALEELLIMQAPLKSDVKAGPPSRDRKTRLRAKLTALADDTHAPDGERDAARRKLAAMRQP